ncbi:unnamed protein product, partial [Leptidea sinapis]
CCAEYQSYAKTAVGRGVMPSVKLALDHVNEHDTVLRNYRLHMWWNDTECNAAVGVKSFFDMMHSGPHKLMLFGAACTHVTDPIAKASKHWHLTQLSYADTHPMFTKEAFPNFFRIVPSENAFNIPRIRLLEHFNWTRVGTLYQNEPRYALAHNRLLADLDNGSFEIAETQSFATEVRTALNKLKEKDIRIILGNFNETWATKIFCEAYKLEMYGRAYTWLLLGTYSHKWWRRGSPCPQAELSTALDTAILTDLLPLLLRITKWSIWAMALAIQIVAHRVKIKYKEKTVQDFRYRDKEWEQLFLDALSNVTFEGVTGPVRFYDNERKASILLKQFQGDLVGEVKVGEYCAERDHLDLSSWEPFKWIGKNPPKDRTLRLIEHTQVNITIYIVLVSCACIGILLATGFLAMNIHYRNQRYIKMSSPHLNNLIIIGCMLTYLSVIFLGLDSSLSSIGILAFGAMFSKTWRVHSIFTDVKLNKKVIKDYQLFMVVGVLLCIDLAIMTTWQVSDPFYRATKQMEAYPHPTSEDIVIVQENEYCQSERMSIFIGVIYIYKGLLLVFGAFLAWETRSVSIPALNDSKHIGLSVYNVLIMCIMGAPIALVLADHKDALFVLIAIFIIFCTTATLCLVFVPKSPGPDLERRLKELRQYNNRYRRTLQAKENELQMLLSKLGDDADQVIRDSKSPATQRTKLHLPKENISHPVVKEVKEPKKEQTKNVSFKNHLDFTSPLPSSKAVPEKDQLAKLPYGWKAPEELSEPVKPVKIQEAAKAEAKTISVLKSSDTLTAKSMPAKIQEPMYTKAAPPKVNKTPELQKKTRIPDGTKTPPREYKTRGHRRMSSSGHVLSDIMRVAQEDLEPPPGSRKRSTGPSRSKTQARGGRHLRRRRLFFYGEEEIIGKIPKGERKRTTLWCRVTCGTPTPSSTHARRLHPPTHPYKEVCQRRVDNSRRIIIEKLKLKPKDVLRTLRLITRRGSEFPQPVSTPPHQGSTKRRQSTAQIRYQEDKPERIESVPKIEELSTVKKASEKIPEKMESPVKRLRQEGEPLKRARGTGDSPRLSQPQTRPDHHKSSPNVASRHKCDTSRPEQRKSYTRGESKRQESAERKIFTASSESELFEYAILPIFQKLLTERHKSQPQGLNLTYGMSCPNISIKCDIVEYL